MREHAANILLRPLTAKETSQVHPSEHYIEYGVNIFVKYTFIVRQPLSFKRFV